MSDMKRSWLVQRLTQPRRSSGIFGSGNPFAFGGGLKNGGLTDEAMALLHEAFDFDYMGAAEFEFGAVPKALDAIAKDHKRLVTHDVTIDLANVPPDWRTKKQHTGERAVWVVCRKGQQGEIEGRIQEWATRKFGEHLKESTRLSASLRPDRPEYHDVDGWLELDNGFFFFTDHTMFARTAGIFGLAVDEQVPA